MKYWIGHVESNEDARAGWCITVGTDQVDALENARAIFIRNGYTGGEIEVWSIGKVVGYYQELPSAGGEK